MLNSYAGVHYSFEHTLYFVLSTDKKKKYNILKEITKTLAEILLFYSNKMGIVFECKTH